MINMTLTRPVINADGSEAEPVETDFNLPLLTIIPLNSLAVDDINVSFEMEVKSSFTSDSLSDTSNENKDESKDDSLEIASRIESLDIENESEVAPCRSSRLVCSDLYTIWLYCI